MAVKKQPDGARGRRCVLGRMRSSSSSNSCCQQHPCHCMRGANMMHPLTLVFIVFCISCVAVNVGQLVPLFASDRWGPDLGGQKSLQMLLGARIPRSPSLATDTGRQNLVKVETDVPANRSVHEATAARSDHVVSTADEEVFVCDRSNYRADVCYIRGDVRVRGDSGTITLHKRMEGTGVEGKETIQPITRKWERSTMLGVKNITLYSVPASTAVEYKCDVRHTKPAIVFSTAGFTGNVYHDFNDVLIPLFITGQHHKGEVVFVVSDYRGWWWARYIRLLKQLSGYKRIVLQTQRKTHCFPEATVGLHIHGELTVDPMRMPNGETIKDFQMLLAKAYDDRSVGSSSSGKGRLIKGTSMPSQQVRHKGGSPLPDLEEDTTYEGRGQDPGLTTSSLEPRGKPRLVLILRHGSRLLLNQNRVVKMAQDLGFEVKKLAPGWYMDLRRMYQMMHSADVVMGVHGAALTHLLFMRPGTVFIQIVPMGTALPASQYYGEPAVKCGLQYLEYRITALESSLIEKYAKDHPVLADPASIVGLGWDKVKEVYLDHQNVRPDIRHLRALLLHAKNILPLSL